jgi:hypothetical protein
MPSDASFRSSSPSLSEFPAAFPADFEPDTAYFHQALAEHNYERVSAGLDTKGYFDLSAAERRDVLERAQKIKLAARAKTVLFVPERNRAAERRLFRWFLGYLIFAGVSIVLLRVFHFL